MTQTANLLVTKIDSGQEQKEVTANEAFDIFDAALSELTHTMSDANYTLSTSTTPQEWQYMVLNMSGTITADRDVICPAHKKVYILVNGCATYNLKLKTSAGTGINVAAGKTAILRCNGTNVVRVTADV